MGRRQRWVWGLLGLLRKLRGANPIGTAHLDSLEFASNQGHFDVYRFTLTGSAQSAEVVVGSQVQSGSN